MSLEEKEFKHISVLLEETIDSLNIKPDGIYVDGTLGGGGHAYEVLKRLSSKGRYIGIDQDEDAIAAASKRLSEFSDQVTIVRSNYCNMKQVIYFLFSMLLFLSISCNKGEDISFEETPYYLGYFEGKVNSQDISIANQSNSHSFIDHGNFWQEVNTDLSGFYWEIPLGVHISDYPYPMLRISLIPLREGEYLIDKGKLLNEEIESTVRITKDDAKIVYHPLKSSFRIQVDSIRFHEGSGTPYIEGKMEGILYNIENSEDSIVIKDAIFGIH